MIWLKGLLAAVIGGAASSATGVLASGEAINWKVILSLAITGGAVGLAAYLKQSPLPGGLK